MATNEEWHRACREIIDHCVAPSMRLLADRMLVQAMLAAESQDLGAVFKATDARGETCHFGSESAALAWAKSGAVERVEPKLQESK